MLHASLINPLLLSNLFTISKILSPTFIKSENIGL